MELNEKAAARSKFKSSQHLKRVHGGRGRGRGGEGGQHKSPLTSSPELQSNYDRYEVSDGEEAAEGEVVRQSEGADLEQLLGESEQFYAQAHSRYRSFIETVDIEPPPVDVSVVEQELALEPELLLQALAQLPLSELLGIDHQFLVGLGHSVEAPTPQEAFQQTLLSPRCLQPQQQQSQPPVQQQQQQQQQQMLSLQQTSSISNSSTITSDTNRQTQAQTTAAPHMATASAAAARDDDNDDVLLQLLLNDTNTSDPSERADKTRTAPAQNAATRDLSHCHNSSGRGDIQPRPPNHSLRDRSGGRAAAAVLVPAAPRSSASVAALIGRDDHALEELLGSSSAAARPLQGAQKQSSGSNTTVRPGGSKKKSLEDWLDDL